MRERPDRTGAAVAAWVLAVAPTVVPRLAGGDQDLGVAAALAIGVGLLVVALSRWQAVWGAVAALAAIGSAAAAVRWGAAYPFAAAWSAGVVATGALVRWSLPPTWPQRSVPVAGLAMGPVIAAQVWWWREPTPLAHVVLVGLAVVVLEVYVRAPAAVGRADAAIARGALGVSRAVTALLAGAVWLLVVVPVSLLSRAVGYSPLDPGWATPTSAWVQVDPRRLRTPDGAPPRPDSTAQLELELHPRARRRARLRLLVPLAAIALIVVAVRQPTWWPFGDDPGVTTTGARDTFTEPFEDDPAFADVPWARDLRLDLLDAWQNLEFNAAVGGWSIRDVAGEHVNVTDGERATVAPDPALGEPVEVWFLGGSAAFGAGQRDQHTIASELVEAAGRDGVPVRVRNLAVPATVSWQSAMLLIERLAYEDPPDLVVFYEGANDLALQDVLAARGDATSDEPASLVDAQIDQVLRERAAAEGSGAGADLPDVATTVPADPLPPEESGALVATRYRKGVEVAGRAAEAAGVPIVHVWQPELRTKVPFSDADQQALDDAAVEASTIEPWRRFSEAARADLDELGVIDLSDALDGTDRAVYWDLVHTNELGARLAAEALYERLEPTLRDLAGS